MRTTPNAFEFESRQLDRIKNPDYRNTKVNVRFRERVFKELCFNYTPAEFHKVPKNGDVGPYFSPYVRKDTDVTVPLSINEMEGILATHPTKRVRQFLSVALDTF